MLNSSNLSPNVPRITNSPTLCVIEGCNNPVLVKKRGWCRSHYCRWQRHGDPLGGAIPLGLTELERFNYYTPNRPENDCWLWNGPVLSKKGYNRDYGLIYIGDDKQMLAHRWSFEHFNGPIPEGLVIDHLCCISLCVNPDDLDAVTQEVNVQRGSLPHYQFQPGWVG